MKKLEQVNDFIDATKSYSLGGYDLDIIYERKRIESRLKKGITAKIEENSFKLPDDVDLSTHLSPPITQGLYGSCYAFSIQSAVETALYKNGDIEDAIIGVSPQLFLNCSKASRKTILLPLGGSAFYEAMNVL